MLTIAQKKPSRRLKKALFVVLGLYLMITASLYALQEKLLFLPTVLDQEHTFIFKHNFEELFFKTEDSASINAIHFKTENPKGVILYFHGNAGDLQRWGIIAGYFVDRQYDVLIMDYRTYGKSTGKLSEQALYSDAQLCYDYVKKQYSEDKITLYGRSLGTGIASYTAAKNNPKQLILETPYYSILDVAQLRFPFFPIKRLLKYELPTHAFLQSVKCPITMIHGTNDMIVPFSSAEKLAEAAPTKTSEFIVIEDGSHNDLANFQQYHTTIKKLL
jgi:fermentation-respiration switch protein FrsA (DUF1100 family)